MYRGRATAGSASSGPSDGGRSWHETKALSASFTGRASTLYTWVGSAIRDAAWPPVRSKPLASFAEQIADAAPVPGGVAILLTAAGKDWDNAARLAVIRGDSATTLVLPAESGRVTARSLQVTWPTVVVRTYVYTDDGRRTVRWRSTNGGKSWRAA